jgi:glycosyltransferase involved in cell wall biosynthesis
MTKRRAGGACHPTVINLGQKVRARWGMSSGSWRDGWTVVAPCFNEEAYIGQMLQSLARQTTPPQRIVVVDNGSTDGTRRVAEAFAATRPDLNIEVVEELRPGKASALRAGFASVDTHYVALCDADTTYPEDYLERAEAMLARGAVAALAIGLRENGSSVANAARRIKVAIAARLMPRQAHSGGFGQAFDTAALRKAGGYCPDRWPFMVADHEIIHRVGAFGRIAHSPHHVCTPSDRRRERRHVDWSLRERLLYHVTPHPLKEWFFYSFLAPRFRRRRMFNVNLRNRDWAPAADQAARLPLSAGAIES